MTEAKDIESQEVVEEAAAKGKESKKDKKSKVTVMKGVAIEEDGMRVAGVHINQLRMPLVGMFVSATVLLISVLSWKQTANPIRWREYAISVPAVTMSFSFLFILMTCKESFYKKSGKYANIVLFICNSHPLPVVVNGSMNVSRHAPTKFHMKSTMLAYFPFFL